MFCISSNKKKGICPAYRCSNKIADKKKFCHKHHARCQKETNPVGYTYSILKQNAKRRNKEFKLTIDDFKEFCEETKYINLKGKKAKCASIDRIDPKKGYERGNIRMISLSDNSKKMHEDKKIDLPF